MTTSQLVMLVAFGCILLAWVGARFRGHREPALNHVFASLIIQSSAAILISFSSDSLSLSMALAAVVLGGVSWMIFELQRLALRPCRI